MNKNALNAFYAGYMTKESSKNTEISAQGNIAAPKRTLSNLNPAKPMDMSDSPLSGAKRENAGQEITKGQITNEIKAPAGAGTPKTPTPLVAGPTTSPLWTPP